MAPAYVTGPLDAAVGRRTCCSAALHRPWCPAISFNEQDNSSTKVGTNLLQDIQMIFRILVGLLFYSDLPLQMSTSYGIKALPAANAL